MIFKHLITILMEVSPTPGNSPAGTRLESKKGDSGMPEISIATMGDPKLAQKVMLTSNPQGDACRHPLIQKEMDTHPNT